MYKIKTRAAHEREAIIEKGVKSSQETIPFYEYQNKSINLPTIRLEIGLPIYRMKNYRTRTAQLKYIHDKKVTADFFEAGQENESVQQAQHDILVLFAKEGRAVSVAPIMEELQTEQQREPLLITTGGVVVNGNRRLAAMRELFAEHPKQFPHFSHVDCAVLPQNVTSDEIREIEVRLQMRPETKLPYSWIVESLAIQELLQSSKSVEYVVSLMKKKKKQIERAARALVEAEIYLKDWLDQPGEYQYVEDAEQFFNDLAAGLEGKEGEILETSRRIAWALLSNPNLKRRVYDYNFSFKEKTDEVVAALIDRLQIDNPSETEDLADKDDIEIDIGAGDGDGSLEALIDAFDDPAQREIVLNEVLAVCDSILELERQGEVGRRALLLVQTANGKLQEVDLTKADPDTYNPIKAQLDSVIQRANKLKGSLDKTNRASS
jgi:hypothetical protein